MRNLWQEEREVINHTLINHYFIQLISRPKFKELILHKKIDSKEIQDIIKNFANIKIRIHHLLDWANPYSMESSQISELSHFYGIDIEDSSMSKFFREREEYYKNLYKNELSPRIRRTLLAVDDVTNYIDELKRESCSMDEAFVDAFRNSVSLLSQTLREFKEKSYAN